MGYKIAFMGTGAVGAYAGAHMAQAGEDVTFIDPWPANVEQMKAHGLKVSHIRDVPEWTTPVRAIHLTELQQTAKGQPFDIAFVCMKSYDTEWAATMIAQYLGPNGFIVSLQNCMNEETIAGVVGWGKVVGCIASSITVDLCEPGHVRRAAGKSGDKHTVFRTGEVHGRITDRVQEIKRLVSYSDSALATTNLWGERWSKLVTNAMANGMSASTGLISKDILTNDSLRKFGARLGSEAIRVGQALGYELEEVHHIDPEIIAKAGEGDPAGHQGIRRAPAGRGRQGRRRRAPSLDGPGHGQRPPHGNRVPEWPDHAQGRRGRHSDAGQSRIGGHREARGERRAQSRSEAHSRSAATNWSRCARVESSIWIVPPLVLGSCATRPVCST